MRHTFKVNMLGSALAAALLISPAQAQTARTVPKQPSRPVVDVTSMRGCPRPTDVKDAQVLTFDEGSLETKLVVNLGKGEFKVVSIKLWRDSLGDTRPLFPVMKAAQVMQGRLKFYSSKLNTDPESALDEFVLIADMGGPQICWAHPGSLLNEGGYPTLSATKPQAAPNVESPTSPAMAGVSDTTPGGTPSATETPAQVAPPSQARTRARNAPRPRANPAARAAQ